MNNYLKFGLSPLLLVIILSCSKSDFSFLPLNEEWIVDKKIVRPKNEMVGHTGFVVGARYLSS